MGNVQELEENDQPLVSLYPSNQCAGLAMPSAFLMPGAVEDTD